MESWVSTAIVAVVACVVLVLPGLPVAYALGLRGLVSWGSAPMLSGVVVAAGALVAGLASVRFSILVVLASVVVFTILAYALFRSSGRWRGPRTATAPRIRRLILLTVLPVALLAIGMQMYRMITAIGDPDNIPQTYDTAYHLNSVRQMLDSGDASVLQMTLTTPGQSSAYYPGLWHEFTTIVVQLTGSTIPLAANWVSILIAAVVWPLSLLAFSRVVFGPRPAALVLTVGLSFVMAQFPNNLMHFGVLYPNLLAYAYLPAILAAFYLLLWRARGRGRIIPLTLVSAGMVSLAAAQPNAIFTLSYIAIPLLIQYAGHLSRIYRRRGNLLRAGVPWVVLAVGMVVAYVGAGRIPMVADFRTSSSWETVLEPSQAITATGTLSLMHPTETSNLPIAVLIIVGMVACLFVKRLRWLPFAYLILCALAVISAAFPGDLRAELTGYWYTDFQRLAAQLPVLGIPLAVVGAGTLLVLARRLLRRWRSVESGRVALHQTMALSSVAVALIAIFALPRTAAFRDSFEMMSKVYAMPSDSTGSDPGLLDEDEYALMQLIPSIVPEDVVIVGNPWDGSSLTYALADRQALYPHMRISTDDSDRIYIVDYLVNANIDPKVCRLVEQENIGFVLRMGNVFWGSEPVGYMGLDGLEEAGVAELVAQSGQARLYEITACG